MKNNTFDFHDHPGLRRRGRGWPERNWEGHDGPGRAGSSGPGWGGRGGPPPWLAALFGPGEGPGPRAPRGPRARRGDVRSAILDVLIAGPLNGYQIIQQITERTDGAWKPSPGSIYPTIQQLEDEGLLEPDPTSKGKSMRLTDDGRAYVAEHAEELAAVWRPFQAEPEHEGEFSSLKPEIGKMMGAVWQIAANGTDAQKRAAVHVLIESRRKLYGILADDDS